MLDYAFAYSLSHIERGRDREEAAVVEAQVEESMAADAPGDVVEAGSLHDILREIVRQGHRMETRLCALGEALLSLSSEPRKTFTTSTPALGPPAPAPDQDQDC